MINAVLIWKDFSQKEDTVPNWCKKKYFKQEKLQELLDNEKCQGNDSKLA